jgi:hypothetical protein
MDGGWLNIFAERFLSIALLRQYLLQSAEGKPTVVFLFSLSPGHSMNGGLKTPAPQTTVPDHKLPAS